MNELLDDLKQTDAIPPISISLPTLGVFYNDDVIGPDADPSDILVRPLGIIDEHNFRDPFLLSMGKSLPKLISRVCSGILDPDKLTEVDVEALLIAIRIASFGSDLNVKHICQNPALKDQDSENPEKLCGQENPIKIDLNEFILRYGPFSDDLFKKFKIPLPTLGQVVDLRPMTYGDSMSIMMSAIKTQSKFDQLVDGNQDDMFIDENIINAYTELLTETNNNNIEALVDSILGVTTKSGKTVGNRDKIKEWLLHLPLTDIDVIRKRIEEITGELRKISEMTYECPKCKYQNTLYVQLDAQKLFTPAGDSETVTKSSASSKTTGKKGNRRSRISQK